MTSVEGTLRLSLSKDLYGNPFSPHKQTLRPRDLKQPDGRALKLRRTYQSMSPIGP